MNAIWSLTVDDYYEIIELAKKNGKKPGDSMEQEFKEIMEKKNRKPLGFTELNREEFLTDHALNGKTILDIVHDDSGKQTCSIVKKKEEK